MATDREELEALQEQWLPVQSTLLRDAADLSLAVHAALETTTGSGGTAASKAANQAIDALRREEVFVMSNTREKKTMMITLTKMIFF